MRAAYRHKRISPSANKVTRGDDDRSGDEREDILSILRELRPFYFWILIAQIALWGTLIVLAERDNCTNAGFSTCIVAIGLKTSGFIPLWFLTSVVLVDIGRFLMVLLPNLRGKIRAEGKAEGADQMYAKWSAWNARRIEAARKGEPFDEPPPEPDGKPQNFS